MPKKPDILAIRPATKSRLFGIEQVDLRFSNGEERTYERLRGSKGGAVLVVPMLDEHTVLLIREYAVGIHRYELALPKGRVEQGENPLQAANRELMEEVGYGAHDISHMSTFTLAPSYFGHQTEIVLARDLYEQRLEGDEPEEIEVVPWKLEHIPQLIATGECTEARSIAALYMARDMLRAEAERG